MGLLDSLKSLFSGGNRSEQDIYQIYARCNRCGEAITTRLNLRRDLSPQDEGGFMARKTLVGNKLCFERIEVTLIFNGSKQLVEQSAVGGEFITADEFEAASENGP